MKTYFPDTNIFLRFFLKDNLPQFSLAKKFLTQAKNQQINIIVLPEIFFEINYVLQKVYHESKVEIIEILFNLAKSSYLNIINREIIIETLNLYQEKNIDLIDAYLLSSAISEKAEVFSFDKDIIKNQT